MRVLSVGRVLPLVTHNNAIITGPVGFQRGEDRVGAAVVHASSSNQMLFIGAKGGGHDLKVGGTGKVMTWPRLVGDYNPKTACGPRNAKLPIHSPPWLISAVLVGWAWGAHVTLPPSTDVARVGSTRRFRA